MADNSEKISPTIDLAAIEKMTSCLKEEMAKTKQEVDQWVESEKISLEQMDLNYANNIRDCESSAVSFQQHEKRLEQRSISFEDLRAKHAAKIQALVEEIDLLKNEEEELQPKVVEVEAVRDKSIESLEKEKKKLEKTESFQHDEFSEMTKVIELYKTIGLEFEKPADSEADSGTLRTKFTQIDMLHPEREFYFSICVDSNNQYHVLECNPMIDNELLQSMTDEVNQTNSFSDLVKGFRRAFRRISSSNESQMSVSA